MRPTDATPSVLIAVPRSALGGGVSAFWDAVAPELGPSVSLVRVGRVQDSDGLPLRALRSLRTTMGSEGPRGEPRDTEP
jgi:hypothetical protein